MRMCYVVIYIQKVRIDAEIAVYDKNLLTCFEVQYEQRHTFFSI
jgi:hypothetical protein